LFVRALTSSMRLIEKTVLEILWESCASDGNLGGLSSSSAASRDAPQNLIMLVITQGQVADRWVWSKTREMSTVIQLSHFN
jgi:hypothetical protein